MTDSIIVRARALIEELSAETATPRSERIGGVLCELMALIEALTGGELGDKVAAAAVRLVGKIDDSAPIAASFVASPTNDPDKMLDSCQAVVAVAIGPARAPLAEFVTRGGIDDVAIIDKDGRKL